MTDAPAPGSTADHEALRKAVEVSERQTRVADLVQCSAAFALDNAAYLRVTELAILCGYQWSNSTTTLEWAKRRLEVLDRQYGRAS